MRGRGHGRGRPIIWLIGASLLVTGALSTAAGAVEEPPHVRLVTRAGTHENGSLDYCWPQRNGETACSDTFGIAPHRVFLRAVGGEIARFEILFRGEPPGTVLLEVWQPVEDTEQPTRLLSQSTLAGSLTPSWRVDLRPGRYALLLKVHWPDQKSGWYQFGVEVVKSAPAPLDKTGVLPRTGVSSRVRLATLLLLSGVALWGALVRTRPTGGH